MHKIEFSEHVKKTEELIPLALDLIDDVFETYQAKRDRCNKLFELLLKASTNAPIGEPSKVAKQHIDRLFDWINAPNPTLSILKDSRELINELQAKYRNADEQDPNPLDYATRVASEYCHICDLYFKYVKFDNNFNQLLEKYDGLLNGDTLNNIPLPAI